jgi:phage/plasmid-like protein (TIGR03299 family)
MAHAIDSITFTGERPWHGLGVEMPGLATTAEALKAGGLDWEAQLAPMLLMRPDGTSFQVPDARAVIRSDKPMGPDAILGVVGEGYKPIQNRDSFSVLDGLLGEGHATIEVAGALNGGRTVWMLCKLPGEIVVAGDDITEKFFLMSNSHDGTAALRMMLTPIRVVCQNTLSAAISRGGRTAHVRHTGDVQSRIDEGIKLLGLVNSQMDKLEEKFRVTASIAMSTESLMTFFDTVFPQALISDERLATMSAQALARHEAEEEKRIKRIARLGELFETGRGADMPGVRGTAWAAYNAVTEWVDHESYTTRTENPLSNIWFGQGARIKEKALEAALMAGK